jgi:ABC-type nitrate/sulfonate/bicarbonate transport system substrate-binding protein
MIEKEGEVRKLINAMLIGFLVLITSCLCYATDEQKDTQKALIRIAYPTATLINGQIGQVLLRTNILEKNNLASEVTGFQYGPPMMEALISGKVDVAFTSEVPATLALAQGQKATIIATFGSLGRSAIMVLADSPVRSTRDLKGKKVGVPFGSSPHRNLLGMLETAGLIPDKDVFVLNIGRDELAALLLKGDVDAIAAWDPAVEQYRQKNKFKIIESKDFFSVVIMNNEFIEKNPEATVNFITALKEAVLFMATHKDEVNKWFSEVSRIDAEIIKVCSAFNSNYRDVNKIGDVDISMSGKFLSALIESAEFTAAQKMASSKPNILNAINGRLCLEGAKKMDDTKYDVKTIKAK